jgi:hypothetical protein
VTRAGLLLLGVVAILTVLAPVVAPNAPDTTFRDMPFAPPSRVRVFDSSGRLAAPYVYPHRLVSRLERRYEEDRTRPFTLRWFRGGRLVDAGETPLLRDCCTARAHPLALRSPPHWAPY